MNDTVYLIIGAAIIIFLLWMYKWYPEGNKNKMNLFIEKLRDLDSSFTKDMVINYLPYKPTDITENTLQYNISKLTTLSFDGHRGYSENSSFNFQFIFIDNHLSEIYRILPSGTKVSFKKFH